LFTGLAFYIQGNLIRSVGLPVDVAIDELKIKVTLCANGIFRNSITCAPGSGVRAGFYSAPGWHHPVIEKLVISIKNEKSILRCCEVRCKR
jgi:hypothetical protein